MATSSDSDSGDTYTWPESMTNIRYYHIDDLESIIQDLGKRGYHVMVRYDPAREDNFWTLTIGCGIFTRRMDTDNPLVVLLEWKREAEMHGKP